MYDSVIFDLDGTLWDSTEEVAISFRKALEQFPEVTDEVTKEKLQSLFGLPLDVIAERLFLSVSPEHARNVMKVCCEYECEHLAKTNAILYDGLEETIKTLAKKYPLFIVSNCQEGYIQCFLEANPFLKEYITDFEYPGRSGKLKADNIRMIIERNQLKSPIYVGDTKADADACKEAKVPFCFASYGFGEVTDYACKINTLSDLVSLLDMK